MSRYVKRPRGEPTNEEFLALLILCPLLVLAWYVARWVFGGDQEENNRC